MALTYATLQTALLAALSKAQPPYSTAPADFAALYPQAISYAEGLIYRDVVMLAERTQDTSLATTPGSRALNLSAMTNPVLVPEGMALITPAGTTNPALGTRVWYTMASLDTIDMAWPQEASAVAPSLLDWTPRYFAMRDALSIVFCPTVNGAYTAEITGLFQPAALSASNTSTYLSSTYPDLLEAACMVYLTGALLHNFGSQADNPQRAVSWEGIYQKLLDGVRSEESRRRGIVPDIGRATK